MKRNLRFPIIILFFMLVWLTGCGIQPASQPAATVVQPQHVEAKLAQATPEVTPTPALMLQLEEEIMTLTPSASTDDLPPEAKQLVRLAREDLAQKQGVAPEAIQLVSVESVEWPDASLGCPQPGMIYAQVITPGFRITLKREGQTYVYHIDRGQLVILCREAGENPEAIQKEPVSVTPTLPSPEDPHLSSPVRQAKEELARRLSIAVDQITLLEVREVVWLKRV